MQVKALLLFTILLVHGFVNAQTPLDIANQRLGKAMDVIDKQDAEIKAQTDQLARQNTLIERLLAQNELLLSQSKLQNEQIRDLSKLKCDTTSFFFGLIKNKRCK